jgi:hypothetical protein
MIQALAISVMGAGVGVFGAGGDGGREATFDGPVPITTHGHNWSGYGVIQAKYKDRLRTPKEDASWLISQLRTELAEWLNNTDRRKPEYYIIATNVILSPKLNTGGLDRVIEEMNHWLTNLGLLGFDIWHADKIDTLLQHYGSVRKHYAAWITSSDLISTLHDSLVTEAHKRQAKTDQAIGVTFPQLEFLSQRFANLDQAGRADDTPLHLAQVFVDVPVVQDHRVARDRRGVVQTIVREADHRLKVDSAPASSGRFVLVGGPGQGKTTISQFLCQMYRAELLRDRNNSSEVRTAIAQIDRQRNLEEVPQPALRRWPVQIALTSLADALARGEADSLLTFLAQRISKRTDVEITADDCRSWLESYPWLVILDGLDEVPNTSNRAELMQAIDEFLAIAHENTADVFILSTTRPQGYKEEFSPKFYKHLTLAPLPSEIAIKYGRLLTEIRLGANIDRIELVTKRLHDAAADPATSRLMVSPLQVTILTLLVTRMGQAPQQRFELFNEYYRVIYQRELEKGGPTSTLLRNHKSNVDTIHHRVGLLLQIAGEKHGENSARISEEQLATLVHDQLRSEEFELGELDRLAAEIVTASTDRLVFLVAPQDDRIGFEIRSLQEFCAAQGITDGTDEQVLERLDSIAYSAYWHNVLLFACGKIFSERRRLRDGVMRICEELNSSDEDPLIGGRTTLAGSQLALELLLDSVAPIGTPKYRKLLAVRASELLHLPPAEYLDRILDAPIDVVSHLYYKATECFGVTDPVQHLTSMRMLSFLADQGDTLALQEITRRCAEASPPTKKLYFELALSSSSTTLISMTAGALLAMGPERAISCIQRYVPFAVGIGEQDLGAGVPAWLAAMVEITRFVDFDRYPSLSGSGRSVAFSLTLLNNLENVEAWECLMEFPDAGQEWSWLPKVADFVVSPSKETLATVVETLARGVAIPAGWIKHLPWQLTLILSELEVSERLVALIRNGEHGDAESWRLAEDRWARGVEVASLCSHSDPPGVGSVETFPLAAVDPIPSIYFSGENSDADEESQRRTLIELTARYQDLRPGLPRQRVAYIILSAIQNRIFGTSFSLDVNSLQPEVILELANTASGYREIPVGWALYAAEVGEWIATLDQIARAHQVRSYLPAYHLSATVLEKADENLRQMILAWLPNPNQVGLGRIIVQLLANSRNSFPLPKATALTTDLITAEFEQSESTYAAAMLALSGVELNVDIHRLVDVITSASFSGDTGLDENSWILMPDLRLRVALYKRQRFQDWQDKARLLHSIDEGQVAIKSSVQQITGDRLEKLR